MGRSKKPKLVAERMLFCLKCGDPVVPVSHLDRKDGRFVCAACAKFVFGPHKMDSIYRIPNEEERKRADELTEFSRTDEFKEAYRELILEAKERSAWLYAYKASPFWYYGTKEQALARKPLPPDPRVKIDLEPFVERVMREMKNELEAEEPQNE